MERVPVISEIADVIDSRKGGRPEGQLRCQIIFESPGCRFKEGR